MALQFASPALCTSNIECVMSAVQQNGAALEAVQKDGMAFASNNLRGNFQNGAALCSSNNGGPRCRMVWRWSVRVQRITFELCGGSECSPAEWFGD